MWPTEDEKGATEEEKCATEDEKWATAEEKWATEDENWATELPVLPYSAFTNSRQVNKFQTNNATKPKEVDRLATKVYPLAVKQII